MARASADSQIPRPRRAPLTPTFSELQQSPQDQGRHGTGRTRGRSRVETAVNAALLGVARGLGRPHWHRSEEAPEPAASPDPARSGRGLKSHRFPQAGVSATGPPWQQGRHTQGLCLCTASACGHWLSAQDAAPGAARGDTDRCAKPRTRQQRCPDLPSGAWRLSRAAEPARASQSHRSHGSSRGDGERSPVLPC